MSGVRRVFAGVNGSLGSLQALRYAAEQARERDARLLPVIAWIRRAVIWLNGASPIFTSGRYGGTRPRHGSGTPSTWDSAACPMT